MLFPTHIAKWPDLEEKVKNWKADHGHTDKGTTDVLVK